MTEATADRIVDALLGRLATEPFRSIELTDVARDADVSLADLRRTFGGKLDILAAYMQRVDAAVLDRIDPALDGEPARDRLFDILMARLDALTPHKTAVSRLVKELRRDPLLAALLNPLVVQSMGFMLSAARIPAAGPMGRARAQALAVAWAGIVPVWAEDEDAGLARTMVAVDKALSRGERLEGIACRLRDMACRLDERLSRGRRNRRPVDDEPVSAGEGI